MKWNKKLIAICSVVLVACLVVAGVLGWKFIAHEKRQSKKIYP